MNNNTVLTGILLMSIITFASRALPFYFIEFFKEHEIIKFIAKALPFPIMIILVFYSIGDISLIKYPYGLPEIISIMSIILIHMLKRNLLMSIFVGVVIYSILFCLMS